MDGVHGQRDLAGAGAVARPRADGSWRRISEGRVMAAEHGDHAHIFDTSKPHRMEDPERLARLNPPAMFGRLGLRPGMHVADLGAGTGVFTVELAKAVGQT